MVDIFDFPASLIPAEQLLRTPGAGVAGGFTKTAMAMFPAPGGRAILDMNYGGALRRGSAPRLFSWALSKVANGNVFRIALWNTPQLISAADMGLSVPAGYETRGVPWDGDLFWDNGMGWDFEPGVVTLSAALEGSIKLVVNFGTLLPTLWHGHAIGHADRAYLVDDIEWDGSTAEITLSMPLRVDVASGDFITFRPKMLGVCQDPDAFKGMFGPTGLVRPGSITFVEAMI